MELIQESREEISLFYHFFPALFRPLPAVKTAGAMDSLGCLLISTPLSKFEK